MKIKQIETFMQRVTIPINKDDCWIINNAVNKQGYPSFNRYLAHRFSAKYLGKMIINGLCVCHKCDNRKCVNPDHLFVGTIQDNNRDRDLKNRTAKGKETNCHKRMFNESEIIFIRTSQLSGSDLAKKFNCNKETIYNIRKNRSYKWVTI